MGRALKLCLEAEPFCKKIKAFVVKDTGENPNNIDDIQVIGIDEAEAFRKQPIIVALNEKNMPGALRELAEKGFDNLMPINAAGDEWSDIKNAFFLDNQEKCYLPYRLLETDDSFHKDSGETKLKVFVVNSVYDKKLSDEMPLRSYEEPVQVGAALTDARICNVDDNSGDSISVKNRQYCELTALYWLWKNTRDDYAGLCHYRRRFDLSEDMIAKIPELAVDIVVTIPVINTEGVGTHYKRVHSDADWEILRQEVHRFSPEYDEDFLFVEKQIYFHPYNMFIMRREVLDAFCGWMFPILFSCEGRIGEKEDAYQNRYPGFLSERLLNVFLYHNKDIYSIYVARKLYLE